MTKIKCFKSVATLYFKAGAQGGSQYTPRQTNIDFNAKFLVDQRAESDLVTLSRVRNMEN